MKVYSKPCKNCLLSPDRIVSGRRMKEIVKGCINQQTHFICHKASMENKDICCHTFFEKFGDHSKNIALAKWLNILEFVAQPEHEKLPTHLEMEKI